MKKRIKKKIFKRKCAYCAYLRNIKRPWTIEELKKKAALREWDIIDYKYIKPNPLIDLDENFRRDPVIFGELPDEKKNQEEK